MRDTDSISYDELFEHLKDNMKLSETDFCDKFGYDENILEQFWSRKMPFDNAEEVESAKQTARTAVRAYKKVWDTKGYTIEKLLYYAGTKVGLPYDFWTVKYWIMFAQAVTGQGDLLEGIDESAKRPT